MEKLSKNYWEERWQNENTPWNIRQVSPPIKAFIDTLTDKNIRIFIPGAGHAHEAVYLHAQGFSNVWVCDWAENAFTDLKSQAADFPSEHLLVCDFFSLELSFDLILEQTFFCALNPSFRTKYVQQVHQLLAPKGKIAGLLFATSFPTEGPPFGGSKEEYLSLFQPSFDILSLELSPLSIRPRLGNELFFCFQKS